MLEAMSTVAVSTPEKGMPVPGDARMAGFTTTMYAIVKKVVTPPTISAYGRDVGFRAPRVYTR
jgi:hypothetical protein